MTVINLFPLEVLVATVSSLTPYMYIHVFDAELLCSKKRISLYVYIPEPSKNHTTFVVALLRPCKITNGVWKIYGTIQGSVKDVSIIRNFKL